MGIWKDSSQTLARHEKKKGFLSLFAQAGEDARPTTKRKRDFAYA